MPVAAVANDPANVVSLGPAARGLEATALRRLFLRATATDAVVVLHDGRVAFERYANGNDADVPHILMSASKALTGLVASILAYRGEIDLEAPVARYVPEVAATAFAEATLRQLIDMRAGVVPDSAQTATYDAAVGWDPEPPGEARRDLQDVFATVPFPRAPHGGTFRYISANTDLFGWALERATGVPLATLVSEVLWKPMGAERPAAVTLTHGGLARAAGGFCATARDVARIGRLIIDGGVAGGRSVIPEAVIEDLFRGGDAAAWRDGEWGRSFAPIAKHVAYRNGWYAVREEPELLFAMGIHGQNLFVDRANRIAIAKFSSWKSRTDYVALPLTHAAVGHIRRALGAPRDRRDRRSYR